MVTINGRTNFTPSVKFNAVLDVKFSDVSPSGSGGAQVLNLTESDDTFQNNALIGATIYLLFVDGILFTQIDAAFSNPLQKEFHFDSTTGTIVFSFAQSDPVPVTIFYTSAATSGLPGAEPVTLQEVLDYCKIDTGIEDDIITDLIITAREQCEDYTGLSIVPRTVTALVNNACGALYLPYGPVISVSSVTDAENVVIDTDNYELQGFYFPRIISPVDCGLTFVYTAGYGIAPEKIKTAIKQQVFFLYENRGEKNVETTLSAQAKSTLQRLRRV